MFPQMLVNGNPVGTIIAPSADIGEGLIDKLGVGDVATLPTETNTELLINSGGATTEEVKDIASLGTLHIQGQGPTSGASIYLDSFGTVGTNITGRRSNGNQASKAGLIANDIILTLRAAGYQAGGAYTTIRSSIVIRAAEIWTAIAQGTIMQFFTTPKSSTVQTLGMTLTPNGNLTVNNGDMEPAVGTRALITGWGVAPTGMVPFSSGIYTSGLTGVSELFAINELSRVRQLTDEAITNISLVGTQNDLVIAPEFGPPGLTASVLRFFNATDITINGMVAGYEGQLVTIISFGVGNVLLNHENTGSVAANRLYNFVQVGPTPLIGGKGRAVYRYTNGRWSLISHDMGGWLTAPFVAGDFTANGSMTWTLTAPDVEMDLYTIINKTLYWNFRYITTTVGGTVNTLLLRKLPNIYSIFGFGGDSLNNGYDNGVVTGVIIFPNSATQLGFAKQAGTNWTLSTNNTKISGMITFPLN